LARTVSVLYSDSDATSFVATVSSSDSPGVVQSFVSHIHDSRPANFLMKFTGRQTATCLRNCVASASQGSSAPIIVRLSFFSLVTRSNQLRCSVSSLSSCSVELSNSSSSFTFIEIKVGALSGSARFQNGILSSVVTISANDDSASFQLDFLRSPTVVSARFLTETSFRLEFDQNIIFQGTVDSSCQCFQDHLSLFGRGAACVLSRETFTVSGGSSFSLAPGDTVTLLPGLIHGSVQVANSLAFPVDSVSGTVALLQPVRSQLPSVQYISPSSIGPCDDLELRVSNPTPRARYAWLCLNDDSVNEATRARSADTRSVKLRSTDLPRLNFGYRFVLSATSLFFQAVNSSVFEVFKLSQAVPNIISSKQSSLITVPIVVTAQVEFSACPVSTADMVFEWTASAADTSLVELLKKYTSSTVMIPERTLSPGRTYVLTCSVFKADDPNTKSVGTYSIETVPSQLQAFVAGGGRTASVESASRDGCICIV
jgi:hypothetical protein